MATVIPIGEPVNEAERQAIAYLRDHLPASYLALHNFEILRDGDAPSRTCSATFSPTLERMTHASRRGASSSTSRTRPRATLDYAQTIGEPGQKGNGPEDRSWGRC